MPAGRTNRMPEERRLPRPPAKCPVCNKEDPHFLAECDMFRSYHNEDMWKIVDKEVVCYCCLRNGFKHNYADCLQKGNNYCRKCNWNHHAVLDCKPPRADGGSRNAG